MENSTYATRKILHVLMLVLCTFTGFAQQIEKSLTTSNGNFIGFLEYKPSNYSPSSSTKYPLIIFLHGVGERGNGTTELYKVKSQALPRYINYGHKMTFTWNGKTETFLVLSPQLSKTYGSWQTFYVAEMIKYAKANLNIDTNRIILTGLSLGGGGVWNYASASPAFASQLAAIAPICGICQMSNGATIANANLPVWSEHATDDPTVSVNCTLNANKAINAANPKVKPLEFIYPTGGHVIWNRSYDTTYTWHEPNIYEWFLGQNKSLAPNQLPVARAGSDINTDLSLATASLNGGASTDSDGKIAKYSWRQVSGPVTTSMTSSKSASTSVSGLNTTGTYSYELTVVDNRTGWHKDTVIINVAIAAVNKAPVAMAGTDLSITLPVNSVSLDGTASNDPDGSISSYSWTKISGPSGYSIASPASAKTIVNGLVEGVYTFRLEVTDDKGAKSTDDILVTVNAAPNLSPLANAGTDQSITLPVSTVRLDGSSSSDPDGTISSYQWSKINGPAAYTIVNSSSAQTDVSGLVEGIYTFGLEVVDNKGARTKDEVMVTVNRAANQLPVAFTGQDITITLPESSVQLDGSNSYDPDGTISAYFWSKTAGPAAYTFTSANNKYNTVSGLTEGLYSFQLEVTDDRGGKATDVVNITVLAAPNTAPIANAGNSINLVLPVNSTTLDGSGSTDPDGSIISYGWSKISGPATFIMTGENTAKPSLSGLVEGSYTFRLLVTDNRNASASSDVIVNVQLSPNQVPSANAGNNISITLPVNSVTLDGSASRDTDGSIISYSWSKASGPSAYSIATPNNKTTSVSGLVQGEYNFMLEVTDDRGAKSSSNVIVVVYPAPNKAPVAHAGQDITITLPVNSATLNGTASYDPDGTISSYGWRRISGPGSYAISSPGVASPQVSNLLEGVSYFQLEITDNHGAKDTDTVMVTVLATPNKKPVANAGSNIAITLPVNSVSLNGTASSDPDGNIISYSWLKIGGPATFSIANGNTALATAGNLIQGQYSFELTVKDNEGALSRDTVTVTVSEKINQAPVAKAGTDQSITLPVNQVNLNGSASYDPDGTIQRHEWTVVKGIAGMTIVNSTSAQCTIAGLQAGEFIFRLTVTDNNGATAWDDIIIKVFPAINLAPVAHAGNDTLIYYPDVEAVLNASGSYDKDGRVAEFAWRQAGGPAQAFITEPTWGITRVTGLQTGEYMFTLTVRDDKGASSNIDTIIVKVVSNLRQEEKIRTYPNPARKKVKLQFSSEVTGNTVVSVYDIYGRVVKTETLAKTQLLMDQTLDISNLKSGIYIVHINIDDKKKMVTRLIIQ